MSKNGLPNMEDISQHSDWPCFYITQRQDDEEVGFYLFFLLNNYKKKSHCIPLIPPHQKTHYWASFAIETFV
jgi:hypothetical protein